MKTGSIKKIILTAILINIIIAQNTIGVLINDEDKSFNGYTLFAPVKTNTTYLIDNYGGVVNQWESDYVPALSAYLLEDGSLLRAAKVEDPNNIETTTGGFEKFDWEGNLTWQYYYGTQHHDIEPLPNGNVLVITNDLKTKEEAIQAGRDTNLLDDESLRSLLIIEVSQVGPDSGTIVWQWNAWDHLVQDFDSTKNNFGIVGDHPELMDINFASNGDANWLHPNSISYDEEFDQIYVSNRRVHEIWVIDHSTTMEEAASHDGGNSGKGGDLLYRWGNPQAYRAGTEADQKLFGQHDAYRVNQPGASYHGNIIIFNNGWDDRGHSSIDEISPPIDGSGNYTLTAGSAYEPANTFWTYTTNPVTDFYSQRYGGSQRLPNGNTLICYSEKGELIEVTNSGEVVWKYGNPISSNGQLVQGQSPEKFSLFRGYKYSPDYPGLVDKNLIPNKYLATNNDNTINTFNLKQNHPNPFNPNTNIEFELSESSYVTLTIYDILGNEIRTLLNQRMEPGVNNIAWDSLDNSGNPVSSGMYFYTIKTDEAKQTKKMLLLR